MNHTVKILSTQLLNHDVIQFRLQRPAGYVFVAGQATELSIDKPRKKGPSPFTFTGLATAPHLELTIKIYKERKGTTATLSEMNAGDSVIISDAWDSFINKGPGVFIAGGAGITPFIALLRQMKVENRIGSQLFFSNKTHEDIFLEDELRSLLGNRYVNILTRESDSNGARLDEAFFKKQVSNFNQPFYVCGPPGFQEAIQKILTSIGAKGELVNVSF